MIKGKAWKFGEDVDTDIIIPARYLVTTDELDLARHCMEPVAPGFAEQVQAGDVIVAGKNFGCGSSREHAPLAIKGAGIAAVIAPSFARIFYRNAFNVGLPAIESAAAAAAIAAGDEVEVDLAGGTIRDLTQGTTHAFAPIPPFMMELIAAGGLMAWLRKEGRTG